MRMFVHKETGALVNLTAQDAEGVCTFEGLEPKAKPATLPSHEFFAAYRGATTKEQAAFSKAHPAEPKDAAALGARLVDVNQELADTKGKLAAAEQVAADRLRALGSYEKDLEKAAADLAAETEAHAAMKKNLAMVEDATSGGDETLAIERGKANALEVERDQLRDHLNRVKADFEASQTNNAGLNKDLAAAHSTIAKLESQVAKPKGAKNG